MIVFVLDQNNLVHHSDDGGTAARRPLCAQPLRTRALAHAAPVVPKRAYLYHGLAEFGGRVHWGFI